MNNCDDGIGLDEKRRKIISSPLKDVKRIDEADEFTTKPGDHIYAKEDGNGKIGFFRFRGYKDRNLNGQQIKPTEMGKYTKVRLERLSTCHEETIKDKIDQTYAP